jgi:hypothetical protein
VSQRIGEAADRRHTAPIASITLWALACGAAVVAVHLASASLPGRLGSYRSGIITILSFTLAILYSVRKHSLWLSVRLLRLAQRMPQAIARRLILLDRLETWRTLHITIGVLALIPFWWHLDAGPATLLERILEGTVMLVVLSGLFGAALHDLLPHSMRVRPNSEVRLEDVEAGYHQLYLEAEESVLGHSEELVHAYLKNVRPLLLGSQPLRRFMWATLHGTDPAPPACASAHRVEAAVDDDDRPRYRDLVAIAERKVRLEHNEFNLRLFRNWLRFHLAFVMLMIFEVAFHVTGVLYFVGF